MSESKLKGTIEERIEQGKKPCILLVAQGKGFLLCKVTKQEAYKKAKHCITVFNADKTEEMSELDTEELTTLLAERLTEMRFAPCKEKGFYKRIQ